MSNITPAVQRVRVAVVGAGVAGLTAANALITTGKLRADELCVLEAQPRIGGRVLTRAFSDALPVNIEIGAAWIHGTHGNAFAALAEQHGIALQEVSKRNPWLHPESCDRFVLQHGATHLSEQQVQATWHVYALLLAELQHLATTTAADAITDGNGVDTLHSQSLAQLVDSLLAQPDSPLSKAVAELAHGRVHVTFCVHLIEIWMGATADALQLEDFVETDLIGDDPGPHCIVPGGMAQFIDALAAPIQAAIATNACVTSITQLKTSTMNEDDASPSDQPTQVLLTCSDSRRVVADFVVVTAALGLLKTDALTFEPALSPTKQAAISRSHMGQYMKVLVQFSSVFWPRDALFMGQLASDCDSERADDLFFPLVFNYFAVKRVAVLEGVVVGARAADASAHLTDDAIVAAFVQQLARAFPEAAAAVTTALTPIAHVVTRWDQDPFAHGAYSCLTVESSDDDPEVLRQAVNDRILFAGEATIYKYQGALQAAYLSGLAAVDDLERFGL